MRLLVDRLRACLDSSRGPSRTTILQHLVTLLNLVIFAIFAFGFKSRYEVFNKHYRGILLPRGLKGVKVEGLNHRDFAKGSSRMRV